MGNLHFSTKWFLACLGFWLAFSIIVTLDQTFGRPYFDHFLRDAVWGFFLVGSVMILVRMWRSRGDEKEFWRAAHGGQLSVLPPKLRRWILGEDDPR